jgi:hypothetical protein
MRKVPVLQPRLPLADTRTVRRGPKRADAFYLSPEWRALLNAIIARRGRRCEDPCCEVRGGRTCGRIFGDHIVELRDGGAALDERNVMLRCAACHACKTAAARAARYGV